MPILFWIKRPRMAVARVLYWLWERRNKDKPWMCPGTVAFCERNLHKQMNALEFGSGRSTRWFAGKVGSLTSVEHVREWHAQVEQQLRDAGVSNVNYLLVPLDHPESAPEQKEYDPPPAYVATADGFADGSLHFAVVDGHYRTHCVRHVVPKLAAGGFLLVDDINLWPSLADLPIPRDWKIVDDSTNGVKRCIIWQKPTH